MSAFRTFAVLRLRLGLGLAGTLAGCGSDDGTASKSEDDRHKKGDGGAFYVTATTLELCPQSCTSVRADEGATLDVEYGCPPAIQ